MRRRVENGGFVVQAIAGTHAVFLAFNVTQELRQKLLGFSIIREDHRENERYWLSGFKTLRVITSPPVSSDPTTAHGESGSASRVITSDFSSPKDPCSSDSATGGGLPESQRYPDLRGS
jgi:hypothetical protein